MTERVLPMTDFNRVIIEGAVDRALRDISRDPRRTLRNLLDLGLMVAKSPMQKKTFQKIAQMMADEDSAYSEVASRVVQQVNRAWMKNVCVNVGYEACILGARAIQQAEQDGGIYIPWCIRLSCGEEGLAPVSMEEIVWQAAKLGIHMFLLDDLGMDPECLRELVVQYPKCTFLVLTEPERLNHWDLSEMRLCQNMVLLLDYDAEGMEEIQTELLRYQYFYGLFRRYHDGNAEAVISQEALEAYLNQPAALLVLIATQGTSPQMRQLVNRETDRIRVSQQYPLILLDAAGDIGVVEEIISHRRMVLRFDGQGQAWEEDGVTELSGANIHTMSLTEILRQKAPNAKGEETYG